MGDLIPIPFIEVESIDGLPEKTSLEPDGHMLYQAADGKEYRISTDSFYQMIHSIAKPISPTDVGPFIANSWYKPSVYSADPGTNYPNAGSLKAIEGFDILFYYNGTSWSKIANKLPGSVAKTTYDKTDNVNPATMKAASDWVLNNYIGNYPLFKQPNVMEAPYLGFSVENGSQNLPNSLRYFPDYSLLKDKYIHKIKAKAAALGDIYIFIYKKSDMSLFQTLTINVTTTIFEYIFASPIDSDLYYVTFTQGFMYFPTSGAKPVKSFTPGSTTISDNGTITLAVEYYTSPSITLPPSDKISDRLTALENNESIEETFEWSNLLLDNAAVGKILVKENASSVYSLTDGKLNITSIGSGLGVVINNNIYLNKRALEFNVKLSNTSTVVYFGTKPIETGAGATTYVVDFGAKLINSTTSFAAMDVNTTDLYRITLSSVDFTSTIKVKNLRTTQEASYSFTVTDMYDQYKIGFNSGGGVIENINVFSMAKEQPYIIFGGDSNTRASNVPNDKRFANLIGDLTGKEYLVSGRSAGTIVGLLSRMALEVPILRPKYYFATIGTNGGNTTANLTTLIDFCEQYGCTVILNRVPLYNTSTTAINSMISDLVTARKLMSVRMDIATSINFDGVTKDDTCFTNESGTLIHANEKGHKQIFDRAKIDIEKVFIEAGKLV